MPSFGRRLRFTAVAALSTVALGVGLFNGLAPVPGSASSHREAPLVSADPQVDGTDLYAFVSPDKPDTVTIISNWIPFEKPAGGPNFYSFAPGVAYDINIDNNGDAGRTSPTGGSSPTTTATRTRSCTTRARSPRSTTRT